jgi:hypothetical protein
MDENPTRKIMRKPSFKKSVLGGNFGSLLEQIIMENRTIFCVPKGRYLNFYTPYNNNLHTILVDCPTQSPWILSSPSSDAIFTLTEILSDYYRKTGKPVLSGNNPYNLNITIL